MESITAVKRTKRKIIGIVEKVVIDGVRGQWTLPSHPKVRKLMIHCSKHIFVFLKTYDLYIKIYIYKNVTGCSMCSAVLQP